MGLLERRYGHTAAPRRSIRTFAKRSVASRGIVALALGVAVAAYSPLSFGAASGFSGAAVASPPPPSSSSSPSSSSVSESDSTAAADSTDTASGRNATQERLDGARELLRDIAEVVQSAGVEAGAVRTYQAVQATALTVLDIFREGEAVNLLQGFRSLLSGGSNPPSEKIIAQSLRQFFERLGPAYIKFGQFIASSPTLFPDVYVKEFQKCLDQTPQIPYETVKMVVEEELGRPLDEVYESFEKEPLASASVAQVHAAVLLGTQENVVVKVQKPGISKTMKADLGFLYIGARVLEFLNPAIAKSSLSDLVGEIRTSMLGELDFELEAQHLLIFRDFLVDNDLTRVATAPRPIPEASAKRVLTMERFYGVPLIDLEGIKANSANPEATLIAALNVWALSVRGCEIFHADVHAGNLLVLKDGRVGFIDFGIVGRVPPKIWQAIEDLTLSLAVNDSLGMARALISMGATAAAIDENRLAKDIEGVLDRLNSIEPEVVLRPVGETGNVAAELGVDESQMTDLLLDIIRVADENGLKLPREFALLVKQALYFDRYNKLLAPGLDPLRDSRVQLGVNVPNPSAAVGRGAEKAASAARAFFPGGSGPIIDV